MSKTQSPVPWSVPLAVRDVPAEGLHRDIVADSAARAAVAELAGVSAITRLEASFDAALFRGEGLHVTGEVSATVGQQCVVTLEPMASEINEAVDVVFIPPGSGALAAAATEKADGVEDEPEILSGGAVDLGAIATEFLILGIDPYPRKPGAVFAAPAAEEERDNPFTVLAALKGRSGGE